MFEKRNSAPQKGIPAAVQETRTEQPTPAAKPKPTANASIGPGLSVSGEVTGKADLNIEGLVEGTIDLPDNIVTVAQSGEVKANVTAATVNISGRVTGDIKGIKQVTLTNTSIVRGNIVGPQVSLENGSKFKGSIDVDPIDDQAGKAAAQLASNTVKAKDAPAKTAAASAPPREGAARH